MKPLKVTTLYFGKLSSLTGASSILKNLIQEFSKYPEIEYDFYSADICNATNQMPGTLGTGTTYGYSIQRVVHRVLGWLASLSSFFSSFYADLVYDRNAINVVKRYGENCADSDILFFHDLFTAFYFRKFYPSDWQKLSKIIVFHNDGNPLKMFYEKFPKIESGNNGKMSYYDKMAECVIEEVDRIVFLSDIARGTFLYKYSRFTFKTAVAPNGLPMISKIMNRKHVTSKNRIIITTVGTVCYRKGHDLILDALLMMTKRKREKIQVNVVGGGGSS